MTTGPVRTQPIRRSLSVPSFRSLLATAQKPRFAFSVFGIGVLMVFSYLLLVNDTATNGLATAKSRQEVRQLQAETRQLEIQLANVQSFATLQRTGQALELTVQGSPTVVVPAGSVAVR